MSKLTKYELLDGINTLFDAGYIETKKLVNINDCIYTQDDLNQICDYFSKTLHKINN